MEIEIWYRAWAPECPGACAPKRPGALKHDCLVDEDSLSLLLNRQIEIK